MDRKESAGIVAVLRGFMKSLLNRRLRVNCRNVADATVASGKLSRPGLRAARLRISPSTLQRRIKALNIHKSQFKFGYPSSTLEFAAYNSI